MSDEEILAELKKITKLLMFAYSDDIKIEIEKVATTPQRKMIWALLDGIHMSNEIAQKIKISTSAVNIFLDKAKILGLAKNPRNEPPYRLIDYVPPEWVDLIPIEEEEPKGE